MRAQLLNIENRQTVRSEDLLRGEEREIAEVFADKSYELIFFHEPHQVRKFDRENAMSALNRIFIPATKSFRLGTWASTSFPSSRSACLPCATSSRAVAVPKNLTKVGTPISTATEATLAAGWMPSTGICFATILKQIPVVAGDLDDQAVWIQNSKRLVICSA